MCLFWIIRERLDGYRCMPRRYCGYAKVVASKSSAAVAAAFGMKNELGRYGKAAACRKFGSEPNTRSTLARKLWHGAASSGLHPNAP